MRKTTFNVWEAPRTSAEMEQDGLALFEALAAAVKDEKVRRFALRLANGRKDHIRLAGASDRRG
jgi:rubrerythrin